MKDYVRWFETLNRDDVLVAGGKGANLGEMMRAELPVPPGFTVTAAAYRAFVESAGLRDEIDRRIAALDVDDRWELETAADDIQKRIRESAIPATVKVAVVEAYRELSHREGAEAEMVAVRSSATMEDSEAASFAGMNRSFLNVQGESDLLHQIREVWASLYSPRVIFYRKRLGFTTEPEIAAIVQKMVDSEKSGVAFSIDPTTGDESVMVIEATFGLGEMVVSGQVEPDHYTVVKTDLSLRDVRIGHKERALIRGQHGGNTLVELDPERANARVLADDELRSVADLVRRDEAHYGTPQDTEWAIENGRIYLVQSRPVTTRGGAKSVAVVETSTDRKELVRGLGASPGRVYGRVKVARSPAEADKLEKGDILVAPMTSPDWVPFMRRAAAIVTDSGGTTSHAAIVSREMGVPCIVGTREATAILVDGQEVTVDATIGVVYAGRIEEPEAATPGADPAITTVAAPARIVTATKIMVNLGEPELAAQVAARPVDGVGLLRAEFMLLSALQGQHPRRLIEAGRGDELVDRMTEQLRIFAQAFTPRPVVYRATDFRTNEFRGLAGGTDFEPHEENPMIGFRGVYRYVRDPGLFRFELASLKRVRHDLPNLHLMLPFARTGSEIRACKRLVDESGLTEDRDFQLWVMAEVPSVVYWLEEYARLGVVGVSIGSNDLTQLVLGVDRDSEVLAPLFDERDRAVVATIEAIIRECRRLGLSSSICGQAPSVYPEYAETLVRFGIDSISVNPDVIDQTRYNVAVAEQRILLGAHRTA
ncbi:MAG: phosphoenolpyruvate synthase [Chloroflexi bacterium]|nr:phosphoenolpyruvate synthase [Chloroflexota bacterium]